MFHGVDMKLQKNHLNAFRSGTLKMLKLDNCEISSDQFIRLFQVLTYAKLERFYLENIKSYDSIAN